MVMYLPINIYATTRNPGLRHPCVLAMSKLYVEIYETIICWYTIPTYMNADDVLQPGETVLCEFDAKTEGERLRGTLLCTEQRLLFIQRNKFSDIRLDAIDVVEVEQESSLNPLVLAGVGIMAATLGIIALAPSFGWWFLPVGAAMVAFGVYTRESRLTLQTSNETYLFETRNEEAVKTVASKIRALTTAPSYV